MGRGGLGWLPSGCTVITSIVILGNLGLSLPSQRLNEQEKRVTPFNEKKKQG